MKKMSIFVSLLLVFMLVLAACTPADEGDPGDVTEPGFGETSVPEGVPTELPGIDVTEAPGVDLTEEPGIDMTEEPGVDVTEEPGVELTEEPGVEATEELVGALFEGPNLMRVSELIGYEIEEDVTGTVTDTETMTGTEGTASLGHIDSLVVNRQDGTLVYALVDPDDALEMDEDLVAIPWSAFRVDGMGGDADVAEADPDDDGPALVYTFDRQLLVDAPGFMDDDESMDVTAPTWDDELATYWSGQVSGLPATGAEEEGGLVRISDVRDNQLMNADGEDIGDIEDMILDPALQKISYVIWAAGGFLDIGEDLIPVPFEKLQWQFDTEADDTISNHFVLNVSDQAAYQDAPTISSLDDLDTTQLDWDADFRTFWEGVEVDSTEN